MKRMTEEHKGFGGMYFICINISCAFVMLICFNLSWASQVVSISDNLAYLVSINSTVYNYTSNRESYTELNPTITYGNKTYNPLDDFNSMLKSSGVSEIEATQCTVSWDKDKKATKIQIGSFKTKLGIVVRPHLQSSTVESF